MFEVGEDGLDYGFPLFQFRLFLGPLLALPLLQDGFLVGSDVDLSSAGTLGATARFGQTPIALIEPTVTVLALALSGQLLTQRTDTAIPLGIVVELAAMAGTG